MTEVSEAVQISQNTEAPSVSSEVTNTAETPVAEAKTETPTQNTDAKKDTNAPQETTTSPEKSKDPLAHKFALLSKREKVLRDRVKEIEQKEKEIAEKTKTFDDFEKDKYGWAQKNGISYEEWTKRLLSGDKTSAETEIAAVRDEITKLRTNIEDEKKKELQDKTNRELTQFVNNLQHHVKANSEKYELITHEGDDGVATVYEYILGYHQKNNKLLSFDQACEDVEKYLTEKALGFTKLKKFQTLQTPKTEAADSSKESPKQDKPIGQKLERPTTLTNQMTAQAATPVQKKLSREESIARAAQLLKFVE